MARQKTSNTKRERLLRLVMLRDDLLIVFLRPVHAFHPDLAEAEAVDLLQYSRASGSAPGA